MGRYDRQIATAARLVSKYGQPVTWRRVADGAPADPLKPWKPTAATNTDVTVDMVFVPKGKNSEFLALMKGTEVPKGELVGYMAAQSFTPTLKDLVIRDGVALSVCSIDPIAPNGDVILYTVSFDL